MVNTTTGSIRSVSSRRRVLRNFSPDIVGRNRSRSTIAGRGAAFDL
jgi:hypothetical protein